MCFPAYITYILLSIIVGFLVILSIFSANLFYALPMMVFAIIQSKITCPKCKQSILKNKNGWYIFTMRSICRHCGQDTLLCEIESDEVTSKRLK